MHPHKFHQVARHFLDDTVQSYQNARVEFAKQASPPRLQSGGIGADSAARDECPEATPARQQRLDSAVGRRLQSSHVNDAYSN
jgi:hypothetical protein